MRQIFHDPDMNRNFVEYGYIQEQVLGDAEIAYLLEQVRKAYADEAFQSLKNNPPYNQIVSTYLGGELNTRLLVNRTVREVFSSHVERLLVGYRIFTCAMLTKPPKGGHVKLHMHIQPTENFQDTVVNFWCPLNDATVENGTFHAIAGSHKIIPEIVHATYDQFYNAYADEIKAKYSTPLPSKAGQAVIFDNTLFHWSPDNLSDSPRYAVHFACMPVESRPVFIYFDKAKPSQFECYYNERYYTDLLFSQDKSPSEMDMTLVSVIPNNNRPYTLEEFEERLNNNKDIRLQLQTEPAQMNQYQVEPGTEVQIRPLSRHEAPQVEAKQDVEISIAVMEPVNTAADIVIVNSQRDQVNTVQVDSQLESQLNAEQRKSIQPSATEIKAEHKPGLRGWLSRLWR